MGRKRRIRVRKAAGTVEDFNAGKFQASLLRSGADPETIDMLVREVMDQVGPETTTREIYRLAHSLLRKQDRTCSMRYSLKKALFRLGPTGYPFERYIGDLFRNYGYKTDVGVTLEGRCVSHEVDVLAVNDGEVAVMECKYHNDKGTTTDVKTALYVRSRVLDLKPTLTGLHRGKRFSGWLVTNTRCTSEALDYSRCAGLKILSWKHPVGRGLEEMIEGRKLYPVTIIHGIQAGLVEKMIQERILLLKDLLSLGTDTLRRRLDLSPDRARTLKRRAEALCT